MPPSRSRPSWPTGWRARATRSPTSARHDRPRRLSRLRLQAGRGGRRRRGRARHRAVRLGHRHLDRGQPQPARALRAGLRAAVGRAGARAQRRQRHRHGRAADRRSDMAKACVDAFLDHRFRAAAAIQRRVEKLSHPPSPKEVRMSIQTPRLSPNDVQPDGFFSQSWPRPIPMFAAIAQRTAAASRPDRADREREHRQSRRCSRRPARSSPTSMPRAIRASATTAAANMSDVVETLAIERAKQLFGCEFANVQPNQRQPDEPGGVPGAADSRATPSWASTSPPAGTSPTARRST